MLLPLVVILVVVTTVKVSAEDPLKSFKWDRRIMTVNKENCKEPLGMYTGAIANSDISCDKSYVDSQSPECGDCRDARYKVDQLPHTQYWCIDFSDTTTASLNISFPYLTYVTSLKIEPVSNDRYCTYIEIQSAIKDAQYSPVLDKDHNIKKISCSQSLMPVEKSAIHFRFIFYGNAVIAAMRFELYGCPFYQYARPLGMQNMHIQQGQFSTDASNPERRDNPWGSRLHSADTGWMVGGNVDNTGADFDTIFLRIHLGSPHKVIFMDYQMLATDDTGQQPYMDFLIKYGFDESSLSSYEDRNDQVSMKPIKHSTDGVVQRLVFKSALHTSLFYVQSLDCKVNCRSFKLELYGAKEDVADHAFNFGTKIFGDSNMYSLINCGTRASATEAGLTMHHPTSRCFMSRMDATTDCLVNPSKCEHGFTVAFWSRNRDVSGTKMTSSMEYISISQRVDGDCRSINVSDVASYANASVFLFIKPMAFHLKFINLTNFADLHSAVINVITPGPVSPKKAFEITAEYYLNPGNAFTDDCLFNGSTSVKPVYTGIVRVDRNAVDKITLWHHLKEIVKLPIWSRDSELVVVTKPAPVTYKSKVGVMPEDLKLDLNNFDDELKAGAAYAPTTCAYNQWNVVAKLPASSFTVNATCADEEPADVRFGQSGFTLCTKLVEKKWDNHLTIDLLESHTFSFVKISDLQTANSNAKLTNFILQISRDGVDFVDHTTNKVTQLDRINAVSGIVEYIPLKSPVVNVRWIRIIPFGHTITASFKFDIVTCENAEDEVESNWVYLGNVTIGAKDKSPGVHQFGHLGYTVTHFKLVLLSGELQISAGTNIYFAIGDNQNGIVVTSNATDPVIPDTTFYSPPNMKESTPYGYYQYPGIKDDSTELVLKNKLPYFFREKSFVNFWMAEDLFDLNTDDNGGEILVEVYVLGKERPGHYIHEICTSFDRCGCLGVDGTGTLVTNDDCNDMFYFDEQGHMIHLNTGRCVKISDDDVGLMTDAYSCDQRFSSDTKSGLYTINPERCVIGGMLVQISSTACSSSAPKYEFLPYVNYDHDYNLKEFKQRFYKVSEVTNGITQADARKQCNKHGMELPMLKTHFEGWLWKKMVSDLQNIENMAWLGTAKGMSHTGFIWDDKTPNDLASSTASHDCLTVMTDGTFFAKPCIDSSAMYQVICQESRTEKANHSDIISSNFMRQTRMMQGNGFNIALRNESRSHAVFSVYVASSDRYARIYVNVNDSQKDLHLAFVFQKTQNLIMAYVNGTEVGRASLIQPLSSRNFDFGLDRVLIFGQDQFTWGQLSLYTLSELRMWRYPLSASAILKLYGSVTYDLSELHPTALDKYMYSFGSICSDVNKITGPCNDVSDNNLNKRIRSTMVDVVPECEWTSGKGESASHELGNTLSLEKCISLCYTFSRNYLNSNVPKINGVSWGKVPTNIETFRKCLCIYSHGAVATSTGEEQSYQTCIFPLPVYKSELINDGTVHQMALSRNKAFIYAASDLAKIVYLNMKTGNWDDKQIDANQVEIDNDSRLWVRHSNVIKDIEGNAFSNAECDDFVVDETFLFCLHQNKKVFRRRKNIEDDDWVFLTENIQKLKISVDNRLYGFTTQWDVVEIGKEVGDQQIISYLRSSSYKNGFKDFDVTPSQRVIIATTNKLVTRYKTYLEIAPGAFYGVRVINDYFVYALKEIGQTIVPVQVPVGKVLMPGYSYSPNNIKNVEEQRAFCQQQGGDLVHNFNNSNNFAAGFSMSANYPGFFWYGARDSTPDGSNIYRSMIDDSLFTNVPYHIGEPNNINERCLIYKENGTFLDISCDWSSTNNVLNAICQVPSKPWLRRTAVVETYLLKNSDGCGKLSSPAKFPASIADTSTSSAVMVFGDLNITRDMDVKNAFLKFHTAATGNDPGVDQIIPYTIGLLYKSHESFESTATCDDFTSINHQELLIPVLWNVSTAGWQAGEPLVTMDIARLINFLLRKDSWGKESKVQILLLPLESSSSSTWLTDINRTQIVIHYEDHSPNRYMLKRSFLGELKVDSIAIGPFRPTIQSVSFWILMKGPHCGVVFVWVGSKLASQMFGEFTTEWKRVWLDLTEFEWEVKSILIVTINNMGPLGHIAFDHFEGFNDTKSVVIGAEKGFYDPKNKTAYVSLLGEFGIPIPDIMYPFQVSTFKKDFGSFQLDLSQSSDDKYYGFIGDKYFFPYHMVRSNGGNEQPNTLLWRSDMSPIGNLIDASNGFTVVVHLYYGHESLNFVKDVEYRMRDNSTLFIFKNQLQRFIVKDYPDGLLFRIRNQTGDVVMERKIEHKERRLYLAISYYNGEGKIYFNNKLRTVFTVDQSVLNPFPSESLTFFRDPDYLLTEWIPKPRENPTASFDQHRDQFLGGLSCFQVFARALTLQQIKQVEFCPNRQARVYHTKSCKSGGEAIVFFADCVCQDYNTRYILKNCLSALIDTVYNGALDYVSFDIPGVKSGLFDVMTLNPATNGKIKFTSGPVNTALCVVNTQTVVNIGNMTSNCVSALSGECANGYVFAFWLFFDENTIDQTVEIFKFHEFSIEVDFESVPRFNNTFHFKMVDCASMSVVLGIRTYHHFTVMVLAGKLKFQLYIDGVLHEEKTCTSGSNGPTSQSLSLGGSTKVCLDEFVVSGIHDKNYPETYYTKIVKGTFSNDPDVKAIKTELLIPTVYITAPTSDDYLKAFEDTSSEPSTILIGMINDIISKTTSSDLPNFRFVKVGKLGYGKDDFVKAENVIFGFERLTWTELEYLEDCPKILELNGKTVEIHCDDMEMLHGLSQLEIKGVPVAPFDAEVQIVNRLPVQESYHLGLKIRLESDSLEEDSDIKKVQERVVHSGMSAHHFDVGLAIQYNVTVWAITHEGYGKGTRETFLSYGDIPYHSPNATAKNSSSTSISVTIDRFPRKLWNEVEIFYTVFYKPIEGDPLKDNDIDEHKKLTNKYTEDDQITVNIASLEQFTNYSIKVAVTNIHGNGPLLNLTCMSGVGSPEEAPTLLAFTPIGNKLEMQWKYTDDIFIWNDWALKSFQVTLYSSAYAQTMVDGPFNYKPSPNTFDKLSNDLDYFRIYKVKVSAIPLGGGLAGVANTYCMLTNPYYPSGGPTHATFEGIKEHSLNLLIGQVNANQENGIIFFYTITYTSLDWDDQIYTLLSDNITHSPINMEQWKRFDDGFIDCSKETPQIPSSSSTMILKTRVKDLKPNTNYRFNITACNQVGCAPSTISTITSITTKTLPGLPDCFPNITSVHNTSSISILANWTHLTHYCKNGDFVKYHVAVFDNDDYPQWVSNKSLITLDDIKKRMISNTTVDDWFEFDNLKNYWRYSLIVIYENVVGFGPISDLVSVFTDEDVPQGPPSVVEASAFNTSAFTINITIPPREKRNGIILGYQVDLINEIDEVHQQNFTCPYLVQWNETVLNEDHSVTNVIFVGLRPFFDYTITVKPFTRVGLGPASIAIVEKTAETVPSGSPTSLLYSEVTPNSTLITWKPIPLIARHGIIRKYLLSLTSILANGTRSTLGPFVKYQNSSSEVNFNFTLENVLFPKTVYNLTLSGCSNAGCGPFTSTSFETLEMSPSGFPLNSTNETGDTRGQLLIQWKDIEPMAKRGIITHYQIEYIKINHTWDVVDSLPMLQLVALDEATKDVSPPTGAQYMSKKIYSDATHLQHMPSLPGLPSIPSPQARSSGTRMKEVKVENKTVKSDASIWYSTRLTNLENFTEYKVRFSGKTYAGFGPFSQYVIYKTPEYVPSAAPVINITGDISAFEVFIKFEDVPREYHQGIITGYRIFYEESNLIQDCTDGGFNFLANCAPRMRSISKTFEELQEKLPNIKLGDKIVDDGLLKTSVDGLLPGVNYTLCVTAYTEVGDGPEDCSWAFSQNAIHGNWTEWTDWGTCDVTCGKGVQMRYRWCTNPVPDNGGDYCVGANSKTNICNDFSCNGYYLAESFKNCNQTCSSVSKDLFCSPVVTPFTRSLIDLWNPSSYTETIDFECPLSANTNYSKLIHPMIDVYDNSCQGFDYTPVKINCAAVPDVNTERRVCYCDDKISPNFSEWGFWSPCTKTCGVGTRQRHRECVNEIGQDTLCPEDKKHEKQDCNTFQCPIHGQWGEWGKWSSCTVACGFGRQYRNRECNNPKPAYGGDDCQFAVYTDYIEGCNDYPCPIHGNWGKWYEIEECTQPCGLGGTKRQRRYCDDPAPLYGGRECIGSNERLYKCNEEKACEDRLAITYKLRFVKEAWDYRMVYKNQDHFKDFSSRINEKVRGLYVNNSFHVRNTIEEIVLNQLERGSVIANFTIFYWEINSAQVVLMQHAIEEDKFINDMPLQKVNITTNQVPNKLLHAHARSYTPFSINITWSDVNVNQTTLYLYYVYYRLLDVTPPTWSVKGFPTTGPNVLIDLLPGTWYGIRIMASVESGNGIATEEFKVATLEGPPYIAPPNLMHDIYNETSIFISWLPISSSQVPGKLLGYRIRYRLYHEYHNNVIKIDVDQYTQNKMINNLKPFSLYWLEVTGFTIAGEGPKSIVIINTPPGAPSIAPNATFQNLYHTSQIKLEWDAIPRQMENGHLAGYKITWKLSSRYGEDANIGQPEFEATVDRYVFGYTIKGLLANSRYTVTLCGYSPQGDGPKHAKNISTCKCPPIIYSNFFDSEPYVKYNRREQSITGLIPHILKMITNKVCTGTCNSYNHSTFYFDRTFSGDPAAKNTEVGVRKTIGQSAHINFPLRGFSTMKKLQGYHPFISLVQFQGTAYIVFHESVKSVGFMGIFMAIFNAWSIIAMGCLLAYLCGCCYWFTEQMSETSEINIQNALLGQIQGFWISFITMTTVGYGDINPSTFFSKVLMIFWALIGLVVCGLIMGVIGSGMTVNTIPAQLKIYGTPTAVIQGTYENRLAIRRNADMSHNRTFYDVESVLEAVSAKEIELGLLDANSLAGYEDRMKDLNLAIGKIYVSSQSFGVVLSDGFEAMETEVRGFVTSQSQEINTFIESQVPRLQPYSLDIEEKVLTDEEFTGLFINALIVLGVLTFLGCLQTLWKFLKGRNVVHPTDGFASNLIAKDIDILVSDFNEIFEEKVSNICDRHQKELSELSTLHKNYKRLLLRTGHSKKKVETAIDKNRKKAVKKLLKNKDRQRFEHLMKVQYNDTAATNIELQERDR